MTDNKDNHTIDIETAIAIETHHSNVLEVQQTYGDNLPYQRDRVVNEARFFMAQSAEAMLQFGKRLVQIRENEPHGEFINIVEHQFKISQTSAKRFMNAAIKFLNIPDANRPTLVDLAPSKLFELMTLDDDILIELSEGESVAGLTLEKIDTSSVRELKEEIKKLKSNLKEVQEDNAAVREVSRKKDEKISKLDEELAKKDQADAKKKRLELEELDSVTVLVNDYTDQYKEVITKLASAIYQLEQIRVEAEKEMLPPRFFKEMALASSHEMERIQSLLEQLPDDTAPLDVSWLPQNKEGEEPLFNNGPLSE